MIKNKKNLLKKTKNLISLIQKMFYDELLLILIVTYLLVPFLYDFFETYWAWKVLMIIGSIIELLIIIILIIGFKNIENKKKFLLYYIPIVILFILNIISYFCYYSVYFRIMIIGFSLLYLLFLGVYNLLKLFTNNTFFSEQFLLTLSTFTIIIIFIGIINYSLDNNESGQLYLKIGIGLLYLLLISKILHKYLYSNKIIGAGQKIIGIIFWCSLIIFSLPYYILWWGLSEKDYGIFLNIYTSLIGGGLTLIGVAWTVKKNNDDRKNDLKNSIKPLIYPILHVNNCDRQVLINTVFYRSLNHQIGTKIGKIQNTDNGILIIKGAIINNINYEMEFPIVLDKNMAAQLVIREEQKIKLESMYLLCSDILGNELKYKIIVNIEKNEIKGIYEE